MALIQRSMVMEVAASRLTRIEAEDAARTLDRWGSSLVHQVMSLPRRARHRAQPRDHRSRGGRQRNDRHSKIRTAQGVRDRRMRLSIDVADRFFALQDMLGFDKASATVDWLLKQSEPAIELATALGADVVVPSAESTDSSNSLQTSADHHMLNYEKVAKETVDVVVDAEDAVDVVIPEARGGGREGEGRQAWESGGRRSIGEKEGL